MAQMQPPTESPFKKVFWPSVDSMESANAAGMFGFAIAAWVSGVTGICAAFKLNGASHLGIVDCLLFALIAWGIKSRMSRTAAICGLTLYVAERIFSHSHGGWSDSIAPTIFYSLFFVSGIRGTFAYQRLLHQRPDGPTRTA